MTEEEEEKTSQEEASGGERERKMEPLRQQVTSENSDA
jgi:hypothetical protein